MRFVRHAKSLWKFQIDLLFWVAFFSQRVHSSAEKRNFSRLQVIFFLFIYFRFGKLSIFFSPSLTYCVVVLVWYGIYWIALICKFLYRHHHLKNVRISIWKLCDICISLVLVCHITWYTVLKSSIIYTMINQNFWFSKPIFYLRSQFVPWQPLAYLTNYLIHFIFHVTKLKSTWVLSACHGSTPWIRTMELC